MKFCNVGTRALVSLVCLGGLLSSGVLSAQTTAPVPAQYQDLAGLLGTQISMFQSQIPAGTTSTTNFSAELMTANSGRGPALLTTPYSGVLMELDSLKAMGVRAVDVGIHFPVLYAAYYQNPSDYQQYVNFYRQLAKDIRSRGLKMVAETGLLLNEPGITSVDCTAFYSSLTLDQYQQGRAQVAVTVAQQIQPDYLTVVDEPDIEASQTGFSALGTPAGSLGLLNNILSALQQAGVSGIPIGAGVGTWLTSYTPFIQAYLGTSIQYVDLHIFPVNQGLLTNVLNIAAMVQAAGKGLAISQTWLQKARDGELGVLTFPQLAARDPFSFWEPLDISFLQAMVSFCRSGQLLFFSPFFSGYFHAYLDQAIAGGLSVDQVTSALYTQVAQNIASGQYTPVAQAYSTLIVGQADTQPPSVPGGLTAVGGTTSVITVSWTPSTDDVGVAGYQVYRNGVAVATTFSLVYYDQNLPSSTSFSYSVAAYDVAGNLSPQAGPVTASTLTPPDTIPPSVPQNLTAQPVSSGQVNLAWAASTDNVGVTGYLVFRGSAAAAPSLLANSPGNAYSDVQVSPATSYTYSVLAYDAAYNQSASSVSVSVTTPQQAPPTVPARLAATAASYNQVNLSWAPSTTATGLGGYLILRGTSPGSLSSIANVAAGNAYADTRVAPSTVYYYAVAAYDIYGMQSTPSSPVAASTPQEPAPTIPAQLTAQVVSYNQVNLSWSSATAASGLSGYVIYRGTSPASLTVVGTTGNATSYSDTKIAPATTYYYGVSANDTFGLQSPVSSTVSAVTPQEPQPSMPGQLTAQVASFNQINLSWTPSSSSSGLGGYVIYRGASPSTLSVIGTVGPVTSYADTKTAPSTLYYYAVAANDIFGLQSKVSNVASATTQQQPAPSTPPGLTAQVVSFGLVNLSWSPSTSASGLGGYVVYRGTSSSNLSVIATAPVSAGTSFADTRVAPATTYFYAVAAYDIFGLQSPQSVPVNASTPAEPAPSVPLRLSAQAVSYGQVNLAWTASASASGVAGYVVLRGTSPSGLATIATTQGTSFSDTRTAPSTLYYYAVAAYDTFGVQSAPSSSVSASTPQEPPPPAPGQPAVRAVSPTQMAVSWNPPGGSTNVAGYVVYRGASPGTLTSIASVSTNSFNDTKVYPGVSYYYAVTAFDSWGLQSARSAAVSATVPTAANALAPPETLAARVVSAHHVTVQWASPAARFLLAGFTVYRGASPSALSAIATTKGLSYDDLSVAASSTYYYQVASNDTTGHKSPPSRAVIARTPNQATVR